jgi:hypothetical protein
MAIQVFVPFVLFVVEKVSRPEFSWVLELKRAGLSPAATRRLPRS